MLMRIFDVLFSGFLLLVASPCLATIAFLIKLDSRGPMFFKQGRVGKNQKIFQMLKFRTMFFNPGKPGSTLTRKNDPRITNFGRFLRHTKLDELPQLINILKGDMSFVGPRPETPDHLPFYTEQELELLRIRPGLVGPGQISNRHEDEMYPDGVDVDAYYVNHILHHKLNIELKYLRKKSFGSDVFYVVKTLGTLLLTTLRLDFVLTNARRLLLFLFDMALVAFSFYFSYLLRYDFDATGFDFLSLRSLVPFVIFIRLSCFVFFGLYRGLALYASFTDFLNIVKATMTSSLLVPVAAFFLQFQGQPRSVFIIDAVLILVLLGFSRFSIAALRHIQAQNGKKESKSVVIVGPVEYSGEIIRTMRTGNGNGSTSRLNVVGLIDKNPRNVGREVDGVRILGEIDNLKDIVRLSHIHTILINQGLMLEEIKRILDESRGEDYEVLILNSEIMDSTKYRELVQDTMTPA